MSENVLEMIEITKVYGNGIIANNKANFSLRPKEIHALMGENGAGKSTLMNILFGLEKPESGVIKINGQEVDITSSSHALELGIGMIHQHFMLIPSFTVVENIILGDEPTRGMFINKKEARTRALKLISDYKFNIDPDEVVRNLPIGKQQQVEILKALYRGAKILILDEPTAVLAPQETELLFAQLKNLRNQGHTLIFISHKIREVIEICDRITILRSGESVGVHDVNTIGDNDQSTSLSEEQISALMVGRDIVLEIEKTDNTPGEEVLRAEKLFYIDDHQKMKLNNLSFRLRSGEILGIAGVEGNGQSELVKLITKLEQTEFGSITINQKNVKDIPIDQLRKEMISYIPSDRIRQGVATASSVADNMIPFLVDEPQYSKYGIINEEKLKTVSNQAIKDYAVKCESGEQLVSMLSGGNMQKVVVAREISGYTKSIAPLVIAEQPSRGIDIGSTTFIHRKLVELRDNGAAVLLVSADLNELLELADSIIVLFNGEITAYFPNTKEVTEEELGKYMLGLDKQVAEELGGIIGG